MFDRSIQKIVQTPLKLIGRYLLKYIQPDQVTFIGFIFGIIMCLLIYFQLFNLALVFLIFNRISDGLDGAMARLTSPTPRGGYFDIVADFIIYAGFVLSFGLSNPDKLLISALLLFSFIGTGTTFLAKAAIQHQVDQSKHSSDQENEINKSFHYASGLIEGTETILFMILCLIFPSYFNLIGFIFFILCLITIVSRIYVCYKELN